MNELNVPMDDSVVPRHVYDSLLKMLQEERQKNAELVSILLERGYEFVGDPRPTRVPVQESNEKQIIAGGKQPWYRVKDRLEKKFARKDSAEAAESDEQVEKVELDED